MLGINTLTLIAALSAPASAGPSSAVTHELNWEVDSMTPSDENWDVFSWSNSINTWGVSGGYGLSRNLTLMAGLHLRKYLNSSYAYNYDSDEDYSYDEIDTSFSVTQLSVGPKLSVELKPWLRPYATAQAVAWLGTMGADDDSSDEENLNQLQWRALSPGIKAAAGFDLVPFRRDKVHWTTHVDFGYAAALSMNFKDKKGTLAGSEEAAPVGTMDLHGFHVNWGVGVHF